MTPTPDQWDRLFSAAADENLKIEIVHRHAPLSRLCDDLSHTERWGKQVFMVIRRGKYSIERKMDFEMYYGDPQGSFDFTVKTIADFFNYILHEKIYGPDAKGAEE